jgi:shikimate kinase
VSDFSGAGFRGFGAMNDVADNGTPRNAEEAALVRALGTQVLVLIGMMGAGKSSIGRRIAARLNLPFVDADDEIEAAHAGLTVPEIFVRYGEPYFRDGEVRVIARLLEGGPSVLATGGGAFLREETQQRIRAKGVSMWLRADPDVIMRRVKRRGDRPLLQTDDPAATIQRLVDERYPIYAKADITVLSRDVPHERIVEECLQMLGAHLRDDGHGTGIRDS